jgi:hypothetical protein
MGPSAVECKIRNRRWGDRKRREHTAFEFFDQTRAPVERFYELLGARASERKLAQDEAVAESLLTEGFRPEDLAFAVEWAIAHISKVKSFGLIPYIMHQALQARDDAQHAEEVQRDAEARIDEQLHQEREEQDRRRRLAELRASLPAETLAALQRRAEEALAADGVDRTSLGYDVLVKLKRDELLERECPPADVGVSRGDRDTAAVEPSTEW